jgi:hypothetical protein
MPTVAAEDDELDDDALRRYRDAFLARGLMHHARWMEHELNGYAVDATARAVPTLMDGAPDGIVEAISRARIRRGRVRVEAGAVLTWPHFFVEPLRVLRDLEARVGPVAGEVLIDLAPGHGEPPTVAFSGNVVRDVVERIGIEVRDALRSAS